MSSSVPWVPGQKVTGMPVLECPVRCTLVCGTAYSIFRSVTHTHWAHEINCHNSQKIANVPLNGKCERKFSPVKKRLSTCTIFNFLCRPRRGTGWVVPETVRDWRCENSVWTEPMIFYIKTGTTAHYGVSMTAVAYVTNGTPGDVDCKTDLNKFRKIQERYRFFD